jgi:hypothetical protein
MLHGQSPHFHTAHMLTYWLMHACTHLMLPPELFQQSSESAAARRKK